MPRTMKTPQADEVFSEGSRLEAEGYFHVFVKDVRDGMPHNKDDMIEGFSCHLQVLGGEHEGKVQGTTLRDGQDTHKDGGEFCRKVQAAFCVATNLLTPDQLNGGDQTFDEGAAVNHQLVIKTRLGKPDANNKRWLDIDGASFFHVDDPRVADVPKVVEAINQIDKAFRRPPEFFAALIPDKKKSAPAATTQSAAPTTPTFDSGGL
jgi:hypothetical protein